MLEIKAETVEFRRSINLHFRGFMNLNTMKGPSKTSKAGVKSQEKDDGQEMNLSNAMKSKGKRSRLEKK